MGEAINVGEGIGTESSVRAGSLLLRGIGQDYVVRPWCEQGFLLVRRRQIANICISGLIGPSLLENKQGVIIREMI